MRKVKDNVVIAEDDAVVILSRETFQHIAQAYQTTGATCENVDAMLLWYEVADAIEIQLKEQDTILESVD